jgi:hypothetical protein
MPPRPGPDTSDMAAGAVVGTVLGMRPGAVLLARRLRRQVWHSLSQQCSHSHKGASARCMRASNVAPPASSASGAGAFACAYAASPSGGVETALRVCTPYGICVLCAAQAPHCPGVDVTRSRVLLSRARRSIAFTSPSIVCLHGPPAPAPPTQPPVPAPLQHLLALAPPRPIRRLPTNACKQAQRYFPFCSK